MKTIIFDFDGTLTYKSPNIWKSIWQTLGYDISSNSYFSYLFKQFITKKISHQEWCDLTCEEFTKQNMNEKILYNLSKQIKLINGANETFSFLKQNNFSLHIVSGNIKQVIQNVLGDNIKYFDSINANNLIFDNKSQLIKINGTNYDFKGKADFIEEYKKKTQTSAKDIIFVGNGGNDEWAYLSGCKTICINPDDTDATNKTMWHKVIYNISNLKDILKEIDVDNCNNFNYYKNHEDDDNEIEK